MDANVTDQTKRWYVVHAYSGFEKSVARALEGELDVVMPDARGHGDSSAPHHGYRYDDLASDVAGLIRGLDIGDRDGALGAASGQGTNIDAEFERQTLHPQATQMQVGAAPRADHEALTRIEDGQQTVHEAHHFRIVQMFELVDEQAEVLADQWQCFEQLVGQRVAGAEIAPGLAERARIERQFIEHAAQSRDQIHAEPADVVVGRVDRDPGDRHALFLERAKRLAHRGGLAEAGRCAQQGHRGLRGADH